MVALAVFAVLFLRLWSLQVLNGEQLLRAAQNNQRREVRVAAPRGAIWDENGLSLVTNVPALVVQVWQSNLPKRKSVRLRELRKLGRVLEMPAREIGAALRKHRNDVLTPVTVKTRITSLQAGYLRERSDDFPGVKIAKASLRYYPHRQLGAHVLGYVGEISQTQLDSLAKQGYHSGDTIGQSGIESIYDRYLRGTPGLEIQRVDSLGRQLGTNTLVVPPHTGNTVRLTLDLKLQMAAEDALRFGIEHARNSGCQGCWYSNGGAIVALDPRDGSIRAMASNPTYPPSLYVGRVRQRALDAAGLTPRTAEGANFPALNRVINAAYPPGSVFKPVTAIAAMQEHILQPFESLLCTGQYEKNGQIFKNWDPFVNEAMTLTTALARSCDTYFYQVGYRFYGMPERLGPRLQAWASRFGFGQKTGVDLGSERSGLLPTPDWRRQTYTKKTDPNWRIDSLWKPGDSIQLAIGQKDLLVTPLQMARFYAAIANGGKLVTPYLVQDVEQPGDNRTPTVVKRRFMPAPPQPTGVDPAALSVVRQGLYAATHDRLLGTSAGVFADFPVPVAGKTGTAEKAVDVPGYPRGHLEDQAWWCGYGPVDSPSIVVCALIENGGHGGAVAAPTALKVFEQYFNASATNVQTGKSD